MQQAKNCIIAAKAYYAEKLNKSAIVELRQFLQEPLAALARKSLVHLGAKP